MKAHIQSDVCRWKRNIVVITKEPMRIYSFKKKEWVKLEPLDTVNNDDGTRIEIPEDVYIAIAQAIKEDNSVPDKKKEYTQGKLEATKEHLDDMRKLVFNQDEVR